MENQKIIENIYQNLKKFIKSNKDNDVINALNEALKDMIIIKNNDNAPKTNKSALNLFISSKRIEGCSEKSLKYYSSILKEMFKKITKLYFLITTDDIRVLLSKYKNDNNVSNTTIDNVRRIYSSFFSWLESENYISKSPARRIHKVKIAKIVKDIYSDETIELMKQNITNLRDLSITELFLSTGIRVGELVRLNINDLDFENRECIVLGKGNKQRKVYFDAKTKIHILQYLKTRKDNNEALFVSQLKPYNRLEISGVEILFRKLGKQIGINKVHPHKFRRTLATKAIDKGMPIEQVQHLLGHAKIDTTLEYAMVDDANVKISHKKYLE